MLSQVAARFTREDMIKTNEELYQRTQLLKDDALESNPPVIASPDSDMQEDSAPISSIGLAKVWYLYSVSLRVCGQYTAF